MVVIKVGSKFRLIAAFVQGNALFFRMEGKAKPVAMFGTAEDKVIG